MSIPENEWIFVHSKMLENPIVMKDAEHFAVWMYLLLNAEFHERKTIFKGREIVLRAGQLVTGRKKISDALRINESKITRILKLFEMDSMVRLESSNKATLITIINWEKYQMCKKSGPSMDGQWTA